MSQVTKTQAYAILGIAPNADGKEIRAAFLRLARIYHPDRFADVPAEVRDEAERRMKDATIAYEMLQAKGAPTRSSKEAIDPQELFKRARVYRETIEAKRKGEVRDRERWSRWADAERRARDRADREAEIAEYIASEVDGPRWVANGSVQDPNRGDATKPRTPETLAARLDAVRRGEKDPLVRRDNPQN